MRPRLASLRIRHIWKPKKEGTVADYVITGKKMNDARTRIVAAEVRQDQGEDHGKPEMWGRGQVITAIEYGKSFLTARKSPMSWTRGWKIHIVVVDGQKFIRTDGNAVKADHLGELPDL